MLINGVLPHDVAAKMQLILMESKLRNPIKLSILLKKIIDIKPNISGLDFVFPHICIIISYFRTSCSSQQG